MIPSILGLNLKDFGNDEIIELLYFSGVVKTYALENSAYVFSFSVSMAQHDQPKN